MLRASFTALIASQLWAGSAFACEIVEYRPTAVQLARDAREFFEQEAAIYEGVLLGTHDYEKGGRFLVLKAYKGAARPFQIVDLPGGSSCYGGVPPFAIGFLAEYKPEMQAFDGLVSDGYVNSWAKQGLIDDGLLTLSNLLRIALIFVAALPVAAIGWVMRRRFKRATARERPRRSTSG